MLKKIQNRGNSSYLIFFKLFFEFFGMKKKIVEIKGKENVQKKLFKIEETATTIKIFEETEKRVLRVF